MLTNRSTPRRIPAMIIGDQIRQERNRRDLSLRSLADRVGVNASYLSRVEAGKVAPSEQLVNRLADALSYDRDELLLMAGRLPAELQAAIERAPGKTASTLRRLGALAVAESTAVYGAPVLAARGETPIEDGFPFEDISEIAEIESWRKEIYRPIYHVHKWWAQRLGSVFRAAILGAASPRGSSVMDMFYEPVRLPGLVVFDPFMGSGTTIGEAHKLGCTAIGRDINPVAYRSARTAMGPMDRHEILALFERLQNGVAQAILSLYKSEDSEGAVCDVLYYFWVKFLRCPACGDSVDLFSNYIFASHAYAAKNPRVHILCPNCGNVFAGSRNEDTVQCTECGVSFDPYAGPAKRTQAQCKECGEEFPIARTAREAGHPPEHRMYAKLVLRHDGNKEYLSATDADHASYHTAKSRLEALCPALPHVRIKDGHNTRQLLNYGYHHWDELFNARQLLALSLLGRAIHGLPETPGRDALATLYSGVLEFNNMFASYKGEGTGAVRHMFSHHILKPERTPIEANVWGTPCSSGAFSTLFRSRLLRAVDYREAPFEVSVTRNGGRKKGRKVYGVSPPMGGRIHGAYPSGGLPDGAVYLSCSDSSNTDLPDRSVDLVVTDPPFFDNVHYSELADFFHVWHGLWGSAAADHQAATTRNPGEVQDTDARAFAEKLRCVLAECHRVLRDDGLLVFSYHHSRDEGWSSVARAVLGAGFSIVQSQPVKSEMSVAAPKSQAREPIDLDVLLVCRKRTADRRKHHSDDVGWEAAREAAAEKIQRFNGTGRKLSRNDVRVILMSQLLVELSGGRSKDELVRCLEMRAEDVRIEIEALSSGQSTATPNERPKGVGREGERTQLTLF